MTIHYVCQKGRPQTLDLVLSLLAELVVGGLVHELLKLIGVGKLQLHKPSRLHGRLVHNRGGLSEVLNIKIIVVNVFIIIFINSSSRTNVRC